MKTCLPLLFVLWIFSSPPLSSQSPDDYSQIESLMLTLRAFQADILFPEVFQNFQNEIESFRNPGSDTNWEAGSNDKETLRQSLEQWISRADKTQQFLKDALAARQRAIEAGSEEFAPEVFRDAESHLHNAADIYQKGNSTRALHLSKEAEMLYRKAEFQSIRNNLLGQIRIQIQEAKDMRAEELVPKSYQYTAKLLAEVETLIEKNRFDDLQLSQKSRDLYTSAKHLLYLARTANFISQAAGNTETVMLRLEERLTLLVNQLNETPTAIKGAEELLAQLQLSAQNLLLAGERLEKRNQQLELENRELERELLTYKSLSDQRLELERKIKQVSVILEENVEKQGQFLTLKIDPFIFDGEGSEISSADPAQLAKLMDALHEFYGYPLLIRFVQPSNGTLAYYQSLASRKAQSIVEYIRSHLLFGDTAIQSAGVAYAPGESGFQPASFLEIRIDLGNYPGLEQHTSGTEAYSKEQNYYK